MKTVLITGSAGLLGSSTVARFKDEGWNVIGIDNNNRAKTLGTPTKELALELDFTDAGAVFKLFEEHKFDSVIHAGGQPSHDWSNDHVIEDFMTNAFGTVLLLEATRRFSPHASFIYISTDKIYGENMFAYGLQTKETRYEPFLQNEQLGFDEDLGLDFAGIRSPFGCGKTAADLYVQEYCQQGWLNTVIFRPGCITGKNHEGAELHGFLAYLTKCIKEGKTYKIFGFEGKQVRDQIHADDLAKAIYFAAERPVVSLSPINPNVYNIGGGPDRSVSVLEAGEMISKKLNKPFLYEFHGERKGDRPWDVHNVHKFRIAYPEWDYEYSLEDIINDLVSK